MNKIMKCFAIVLAYGFTFPAQAQTLVLGVTEGVTYKVTTEEIEARFDQIGKALSLRLKLPVKIQIIGSYDSLRETLKQGQVDMAFVHPAHLALEAIKNGAYRSVAWTSGFTDYKVSLLCNDSKLIGDWASVSGKTFVSPDPASITTLMMRAMLREHRVKFADVMLQTTRYQDAVPFYVEKGFAAYGGTAAKNVIKAWTDNGGKICAESQPVPIKQWIISNKLDAATVSAVQETLLTLDQSDVGKRALAASTYKSFVAPSAEVEKKLIQWLGI